MEEVNSVSKFEEQYLDTLKDGTPDGRFIAVAWDFAVRIGKMSNEQVVGSRTQHVIDYSEAYDTAWITARVEMPLFKDEAEEIATKIFDAALEETIEQFREYFEGDGQKHLKLRSEGHYEVELPVVFQIIHKDSE